MQDEALAAYDMEPEGVLGEGGFGKVLKARRRKTGSPVAMKVVLKEPLDEELLVMQRREVHIHSDLRHRNIVRLFESIEDETRVILVLKLAPLESCTNFASPRKTIDSMMSSQPERRDMWVLECITCISWDTSTGTSKERMCSLVTVSCSRFRISGVRRL